MVIKVSQNHAQSQRSAEPTKHKLEILVENMGRTNFVWDMKRMRKGNVSKCSNYMQKATTYAAYEEVAAFNKSSIYYFCHCIYMNQMIISVWVPFWTFTNDNCVTKQLVTQKCPKSGIGH